MSKKRRNKTTSMREFITPLKNIANFQTKLTEKYAKLEKELLKKSNP